MRQDTLQLFNVVSTLPDIQPFLFVGGTAISMLANHRVSEDLDFGFLGSSLPRKTVGKIIDTLSNQFPVLNITDPAAIADAENEGIDLMDHHQDWKVGSVKLTFFCLGSNQQERDAIGSFPVLNKGSVRMLDMDGLFFTKALVLTDRIKSRDIFDLWWFVKHGGKSINDIFTTIQGVRPHISYEMIRLRLLDWKIPATDEGLESVIDMGIDQVRQELRGYVNAMEVKLADHLMDEQA